MDKLTEIQGNVLDYIRHYHTEHEVAPSMRDVQHYFGWKSPNSAQAHMRALERKGALRKTPRGYVPA